MPIPLSLPIPSNELIRRWRERQQEILQKLPADLIEEFNRLGALIQGVTDEEKRLALEQRKQRQIKSDVSSSFSAARVPRGIQKNKLIDFLTKHGPATRPQMAAQTGIPIGTLSTLLSTEEGFAQVERGLWTVAKSSK